MIRINYWAVGAAAVAMLVASSVYYSVFGGVWSSLRGEPTTRPELWEAAAQLGRNVVVVLALAALLSRLRVGTLPGALGLGVTVWLGFQAMAVAGSVLHEDYPAGLYVLHIGDSLMCTLLAVAILAAWRPAASGAGARTDARLEEVASS
ncbi:DUF1761 domain-containing protein [Spirillospora sp. CA-294931]|uniref:DUF1761 domain-containing protein n=1 Tax=Spirillospora sp. CA-294931 TaxID=3240042 RepID=UPI003D8DD11E